MTVTAPTLSETYAALDKAIATITNKKMIVDSLQADIDKKTDDLRAAVKTYNEAVQVAQGLKQQLHDTLESVIPTIKGERVR